MSSVWLMVWVLSAGVFRCCCGRWEGVDEFGLTTSNGGREDGQELTPNPPSASLDQFTNDDWLRKQKPLKVFGQPELRLPTGLRFRPRAGQSPSPLDIGQAVTFVGVTAENGGDVDDANSESIQRSSSSSEEWTTSETDRLTVGHWSTTTTTATTSTDTIGTKIDDQQQEPTVSVGQTAAARRGIRVITTPAGLLWRQVASFNVTSSQLLDFQRQIEPTEAATEAPTIDDESPDQTRTTAELELLNPSFPADSTPKPVVFRFGTSATQSPIVNRIKGKPHILCMASGIMFIAETYLEFNGRLYAKGKEDQSHCVYDAGHRSELGFISGKEMNVTFTYTECGDPVMAQAGDHAYQTNVVVEFDNDHSQTFLTHCVSQKLRYETEDLAAKIEEALEELNITPVKIESQAPMPMCTMKVVQEFVGEQSGYGPSNNSVANDAFIGQQLRMEFALNPPSEAFGFLIRNCTVLDSAVNTRYVIIDDKGCSVDINIFAHPHYDIRNDLAIVNWLAFKVPDNTQLSFQCDCVVCTEVTDDDTGETSCEQIPTPPVCPDVVTSSLLQNSLIFDLNQNQLSPIKKKKRRRADAQNVSTAFCLSENRLENNQCQVEIDDVGHFQRIVADEKSIDTGLCFSKQMFAISLAFNCALFVTSLVVFCLCLIRDRKRSIDYSCPVAPVASMRINDRPPPIEQRSSTRERTPKTAIDCETLDRYDRSDAEPVVASLKL